MGQWHIKVYTIKKKGKRKNKKNLSKGSKVLLVFILVSCGFEKYVYHFQGMFRFNDPCGVTGLVKRTFSIHSICKTNTLKNIHAYRYIWIIIA